MKPTRTLHLRREALVDLSPNELAGVAAGEENVTNGAVCLVIVTIVVTCLPSRTCFPPVDTG